VAFTGYIIFYQEQAPVSYDRALRQLFEFLDVNKAENAVLLEKAGFADEERCLGEWEDVSLERILQDILPRRREIDCLYCWWDRHPLQERLCEEIDKALPEEIRDNWCPCLSDAVITLGPRLWDNALQDHMFTSAWSFSVHTFYGCPNDWERAREIIRNCPTFQVIVDRLNSLFGPVKHFTYWYG